MDRLILENFRCFRGKHSVPIRPVTVLVGENSSGKTTLLAAARLAWDAAHRPSERGIFNEQPFLLGAYDDIAHRAGGQTTGADSFKVGFELDVGSDTGIEGVDLAATFVRADLQPALRKWRLGSDGFSIEVDLTAVGPALTVKTPSGEFEGPSTLKPVAFGKTSVEETRTLLYLWKTLYDAGLRGEFFPRTEELDTLEAIIASIPDQLGCRPYAFAPIRMPSRRTYDPAEYYTEMKGSHVPVILAKAFSSDQDLWNNLHDALADFGTQSGLFEDVDIRLIGEQEDDPFQIQVRIAGAAYNIVDVGYGVSQILPIIVDSVRSSEIRTFLIQQPEVHLHPRAQAALGSFLASVAKDQNKCFIVETHSDYFLDRLRIEIRENENVDASDVVILYFERGPDGTVIHPIEIDKDGNLVNAPGSYRQFFLDESRSFLGI